MHVARPRSAPLVICLQAMLLGLQVADRALPATANFHKHAARQKNLLCLRSYSSTTTTESCDIMIELRSSLKVKRLTAGREKACLAEE